jgi:acetyltransferase
MKSEEQQRARKVLRLGGSTEITIRPIQPEDAGIEQDFVQQLSPETRRRRFLAAVRELTPRALERFTRPEYPQEQALIATIIEAGVEKEIGVARYAAEPGGVNAEFAIVIADEWQGKGLGRRMMQELLEAATAAGMCQLEGLVLRDNRHMLQMVQDLGFRIENDPEDSGLAYVRIKLPVAQRARNEFIPPH